MPGHPVGEELPPAQEDLRAQIRFKDPALWTCLLDAEGAWAWRPLAHAPEVDALAAEVAALAAAPPAFKRFHHQGDAAVAANAGVAVPIDTTWELPPGVWDADLVFFLRARVSASSPDEPVVGVRVAYPADGGWVGCGASADL